MTVPWPVTDAPGDSGGLSRYGCHEPYAADLSNLNDRHVPKPRRRWSGAPTHHSGTRVPGAETHRARSQDVVTTGGHRPVEAKGIAVRRGGAEAP
jgi:hypothetical protein